MPEIYGKLYVVATPIGNLADFSLRAVDVLRQVDLIAAEDTRHVRALLNHYQIQNQLVSLHQHNEAQVSAVLVEKMLHGSSIALVSDAGTPLLSDPGMPLVKLAKERGLTVSPIPGACALIAALSACGLPVTRFCFEGFIPRTSSARRSFFAERVNLTATWVFYESCHRILAALEDMAAVLPLDRQIVLARELTKLHETIAKDSLANLLQWVQTDANMQRGELVVIVQGASVDKTAQDVTPAQLQVLKILLKECSIKSAAAMAAEITGGRKKALYQAALQLAAN